MAATYTFALTLWLHTVTLGVLKLFIVGFFLENNKNNQNGHQKSKMATAYAHLLTLPHWL
jgi:hypothetical protein